MRAVDIYGSDPKVILAGLADGAKHAKCPDCRDVMQRAHTLLQQLLADDDARRRCHDRNRSTNGRRTP